MVKGQGPSSQAQQGSSTEPLAATGTTPPVISATAATASTTLPIATPLKFTRAIEMIETEHHQSQKVPPPESSYWQEDPLAIPSREVIAASGGLMEGNLVRFQANQGNPSRRREDLWWCFMTDCGQSNFGSRTNCRDCGHASYNTLHPVVRGLKPSSSSRSCVPRRGLRPTPLNCNHHHTTHHHHKFWLNISFTFFSKL